MGKFLAKKNLLLCFIFMNSAVPVVLAFVSIGFVIIVLLEQKKELMAAYEIKVG